MHGNRKWTPQRVELLKKYKEQGISDQELSSIFGCSPAAVNIAVTRYLNQHKEKLPPRVRVQFGMGKSVCVPNKDVFEVKKEAMEVFGNYPKDITTAEGPRNKGRESITVTCRMEYRSDKLPVSKSFTLYRITPEDAMQYYIANSKLIP